MLNRVSYIFFIIILFFCVVPYTFAQEKINKFDTEITVNKDGTVDIVEIINYDFGEEYRHGIYREINIFKVNNENKKYLLKFKVSGVTNLDGIKYKYTQSEDRGRGKLILKIGDPDKTITGVNSYIISYTVFGTITYFSDHDEFYWNTTGNDWNVPITISSSNIKLPEDINLEETSALCYTGVYESSENNCSITEENNTINIQTSKNLNSNEGLTTVVSFPKNHIAVLEPQIYIPFWETWLGNILKFILFGLLILGIILWYVFYPIYIIYRWFRYGRDPSALIGKVRAWFNPPKTKEGRPLTPGEAGTLIDETVHLHDISSSIVELARRGYLKIEEKKKKDFYFIKRKKYEVDKKLLLFEKELLQGIFSSSKNVRLKDKKLYSTISTVKEEIYNQLVKDGFFPKNPEKIRNFYILISILGLVTVNIPLALIAAIFGRIMPRKTLDGVNAANISHSLKNFLGSQERQLEFQAKNQMFFEKLLPYAVAFGVEKVWARRFQDINMKEPDWYSGQSTTFNSVIFANSLNSSFKSVATSATPTTSSSGFSSGSSSGGGFSGGGGGGGGGGSW